MITEQKFACSQKLALHGMAKKKLTSLPSQWAKKASMLKKKERKQQENKQEKQEGKQEDKQQKQNNKVP